MICACCFTQKAQKKANTLNDKGYFIKKVALIC